MKCRARRRERGGRIERKGTTPEKRGQDVDVGGATGGDAEFKWGGGEANVGGGVSISGCDGLQWGPRREPDAVV